MIVSNQRELTQQVLTVMGRSLIGLLPYRAVRWGLRGLPTEA